MWRCLQTRAASCLPSRAVLQLSSFLHKVGGGGEREMEREGESEMEREEEREGERAAPFLSSSSSSSSLPNLKEPEQSRLHPLPEQTMLSS